LKLESNFNIIALTTVLAGFLIGCNGDAKTDSSTSSNDKPSATNSKLTGEPIKIGVVASVSGDTKPWGDDQMEGAKLAVEEFNNAGGLNGRPVTIIDGDAGSKPEAAKAAAEKVLAENVVAMVGEVSSGNTINIAKSCISAKTPVPLVAVGATRTDLTETGANIYRVCYTDDFQGPVMAQFAFEKLNLKKVAVMTDNNLPYSQGLSKSFIKKFTELGGTIVKEAFYESGGKQAPEYSSQLTELKALNPEGMFCSGYFPEVGPMANQAAKIGLNVKFLGGDGWDSDKLLEGGGDAIIGSFFCNHYNNFDTREQVKSFLDKWKAGHSGKLPATTMGALGFDAMAVTLDALKRAKTVSAADIALALADTVDFKGVSGDITLKGTGGNPPKRAIIVEVTKKDAEGNWQKFAVDYTPEQLNKK
jgi:branched-chain amino acid transport system substrate-binding protein